MKKFKFIIEGVVSPGNATPAGGSAGEGEGEGEGEPSKESGSEGQPGQPGQPGKPGKPGQPGKPGAEGSPGKPGSNGTPTPGKGKIPVNDMQEGPGPKGLPGSDAPGDKEADQDTEVETKRKAHDHAKQVEASKGISRARTNLGEVEVVEADYKAILRDMFGSFQPKGSRSWSKAHSRSPVRMSMGSSMIPGRVKGKPTVGNILIGIDTSGSITEQMLQEYLGTVFGLAHEHQKSLGTIRIVLYSGTVWHYVDFEPQRSTKDPDLMVKQISKAIQEGYSGGNNWSLTMKGIFEGGFKDLITGRTVNLNDTAIPTDKFNGFIFLTDCIEGEFEKSYLPDGPTVFLIPSAGFDEETSDSIPFIRWAKNTKPDVQIVLINLA